MIFEKYRLQGAAWTALSEGDGVAILQELLIFEISDQNKFFVTKSLSPSGLYILIYLILTICDKCPKNTFFCYFVTLVVRFIYFDISTVTLKYILIYHTDMSKKSQCHL